MSGEGLQAETQDALMGGRVVLRQPEVGYRAGLDAALLAAAVTLTAGQRGMEAGCGAGAALLQAATRSPQARFTGVERDPDALERACRNIALNGMAARVAALAGEVARPFSSLGQPPFDAAFANPPFFDDPASLRAPHPARRSAYVADDGLEAWIGFLLKAVREGGRITVIHRADRLGDILALLQGRAGGVRIRPVQPFADAPAKRVLVQAVKAGRAPLALLAPLVLHARGEAALGWA